MSSPISPRAFLLQSSKINDFIFLKDKKSVVSTQEDTTLLSWHFSCINLFSLQPCLPTSNLQSEFLQREVCVLHIPPFSPAVRFLLPSLLLLFFLPLIPAASATLFPSCCLSAHSSSSVSCSQAERSALGKSQEMPHARHQSKQPGPTKASSISVITWDKRHYRRT